MEFSLEARTAQLSVGELSDFQIGPRESGDGPQGIWRAQLGTRWHQELRQQVSVERKEATFEVVIAGTVVHQGWTISLSGRIDQLLPPEAGSGTRTASPAVLREIKTVLRPIPAAEEELRAEHPEYFAQLATYLALAKLGPALHPGIGPQTPLRAELLFVEAGSGLAQSILLGPADESLFLVRLERLCEFLNLRLRARERLSRLQYRPAFASLRPGQETVQSELQAHLADRPITFFEAPTGFGKTGALLEASLSLLKTGAVERVLYLTSKATGQLQVALQLGNMTLPASPDAEGRPLAVWQVRNKREHCVNTAFHCVRDNCRFLHDIPQRWTQHSLSRFYLHENEDRSMEAVRKAGESAGICPYEITRTVLAFNDVWIGDYNYVFAPSNRRLFFDQPGFDPARTLLIIDEAHNLPGRVADAHSHGFSATAAAGVAEVLYQHRTYEPLVSAWGHWVHFLQHLPVSDALRPAEEEDARDLLHAVAKHLGAIGLDYAALGPAVSEALWGIPGFLSGLDLDLPRLWWSPRPGELLVTCLDAARAIGPALRSFRRTVLASATLSPVDAFAAACGLDTTGTPELPDPVAPVPERLGSLNKRQTKKLFGQLSTGADLLAVGRQRETSSPALVRAGTPWRDHAYDVAVDLRVDTSYQQRARHHPATARTVEALCAAAAKRPQGAASTACVAVFFPSYGYAEQILRQLGDLGSAVRATLQPRLPDLASQQRWMEAALDSADAVFLALGSSFAEGVDILGGRVGWAMVVGPALPEVNAIQRARTTALAGLPREAAFRRVYQIPGIQKVNQALGRLVRAPGQQARILLHCRRFAETSYANLLAPEYQGGRRLEEDADLQRWLEAPLAR